MSPSPTHTDRASEQIGEANHKILGDDEKLEMSDVQRQKIMDEIKGNFAVSWSCLTQHIFVKEINNNYLLSLPQLWNKNLATGVRFSQGECKRKRYQQMFS